MERSGNLILPHKGDCHMARNIKSAATTGRIHNPTIDKTRITNRYPPKVIKLPPFWAALSELVIHRTRRSTPEVFLEGIRMLLKEAMELGIITPAEVRFLVQETAPTLEETVMRYVKTVRELEGTDDKEENTE